MKISGLGGIRATEPKKKKNASSESSKSDFSSLVEGKEESGATSSTNPLNVSQAIIGLQEVDWQEQNRKENMARGHHVLDMLEAIRNGLLIGKISIAQLQKLQSTLAQKKDAIEDPKLASIIQEIEVRAAVELAKLEKLHY